MLLDRRIAACGISHFCQGFCEFVCCSGARYRVVQACQTVMEDLDDVGLGAIGPDGPSEYVLLVTLIVLPSVVTRATGI